MFSEVGGAMDVEFPCRMSIKRIKKHPWHRSLSILRNVICHYTVFEIKGAPCTRCALFTTRCTIFGDVHPVCAYFLSYFSLLYIGRVHGGMSGCVILGAVHPVSAKNKNLLFLTLHYNMQPPQILTFRRYTHAI